MERPRHFEEIEIGESRETYGRTITETDFVVHAGHTGDFFPHHMDAEFMAKSEFGGRNDASARKVQGPGINRGAGNFFIDKPEETNVRIKGRRVVITQVIDINPQSNLIGLTRFNREGYLIVV